MGGGVEADSVTESAQVVQSWVWSAGSLLHDGGSASKGALLIA